jgi:hypothetical protein
MIINKLRQIINVQKYNIFSTERYNAFLEESEKSQPSGSFCTITKFRRHDSSQNEGNIFFRIINIWHKKSDQKTAAGGAVSGLFRFPGSSEKTKRADT